MATDRAPRPKRDAAPFADVVNITDRPRPRKEIIADPQAERGTLGSILIDPRRYEDVAGFLRPDDFYEERHRLIYRAMVAIRARGEELDLLTLETEIANEQHLADVGGQSYTHSLTNAVPTSLRAVRYATIVLEKSIERQIQELGSRMTSYQISATEAMRELRSIEERREALDAKDIITLDELMLKDLPPVKWVVPHFIPEGLSVLAAKQKIGKSWLAYALAIAVGGGGFVLGQRVDAGEALYLALEDSEKRLQDRARKMLGQSPIPKGVTLATKWPRLNAGGAEKIELWLKNHPRARLVIVDVFAKVKPPRGKNADPYAEDYAAMELMKTLADRYHVAVIVIHHTRKAEAADVYDEISGSVGIAGACDTVMVLTRARGEADAVLNVTGRDTEVEGQHALRFDRDTCTWRVLGDAAEFAMSAERRQILDAVKALSALQGLDGKPFGAATPKEVASYLQAHTGEGNYHTIKNIMTMMARDGHFKVLDGGKYTVMNHIVSIVPNRTSPDDSPKTSDYGHSLAHSLAETTQTTETMKTTQTTETTHLLQIREVIRSWAAEHGWPEVKLLNNGVLDAGETYWRIWLRTASLDELKYVLVGIS